MITPPTWTADYIGLPFKEKGRDRSGVDCWGLVRLVLGEQWGIALPSYTDHYACALERKEIARLIAGEKGAWRDVGRGAERPGDVLLIRQVGDECHVGLVVAPGLMLHVEAGIDAALERYDGLKWRPRVVGIYRWAGLE